MLSICVLRIPTHTLYYPAITTHKDKCASSTNDSFFSNISFLLSSIFQIHKYSKLVFSAVVHASLTTGSLSVRVVRKVCS